MTWCEHTVVWRQLGGAFQVWLNVSFCLLWMLSERKKPFGLLITSPQLPSQTCQAAPNTELPFPLAPAQPCSLARCSFQASLPEAAETLLFLPFNFQGYTNTKRHIYFTDVGNCRTMMESVFHRCEEPQDYHGVSISYMWGTAGLS